MASQRLQPFVKCLPCSHWSVDLDDEMFCDWYGVKCREQMACPVRTCRMIQSINAECLKLLLFNPKNKELCSK